MYGFGKFGGIKLGTREDTDEEPGRFRRPRKLSYLLRHPEFDARHVGGVNAACFAPCIRGGGADGGADGGAVTQLYTAGRDGTVRAWNTSSLAKRGASMDTCDERWEGHSSWVNDVCGQFIFWLFLVIFGYFWLFLVISTRAIRLTSCFVHRPSHRLG